MRDYKSMAYDNITLYGRECFVEGEKYATSKIVDGVVELLLPYDLSYLEEMAEINSSELLNNWIQIIKEEEKINVAKESEEKYCKMKLFDWLYNMVKENNHGR